LDGRSLLTRTLVEFRRSLEGKKDVAEICSIPLKADGMSGVACFKLARRALLEAVSLIDCDWSELEVEDLVVREKTRRYTFFYRSS
jgi:hypothetical protein